MEMNANTNFSTAGPTGSRRIAFNQHFPRKVQATATNPARACMCVDCSLLMITESGQLLGSIYQKLTVHGLKNGTVFCY